MIINYALSWLIRRFKLRNHQAISEVRIYAINQMIREWKKALVYV